MSKTSKYQTAYLEYRTAQINAERMHDPDLTPEANRARRAEARAAARAKLRQAIPQRPTGPDPRDAVLGTLAATTADQIAVQGREREKIETLLARGTHLSQVIAQADERRLSAILDWLETSDRVLNSPDPLAAQAELRGAVFDRLAGLGYDGTQQARDIAAEREQTTAWVDALESAASGEQVGYGPRAVIFQADPEAYHGTLGMSSPPRTRGPSPTRTSTPAPTCSASRRRTVSRTSRGRTSDRPQHGPDRTGEAGRGDPRGPGPGADAAAGGG